MIRVNLIGGPKKAAGGKGKGRKGFGLQAPTNVLPIVWVAIFLGTAAAGYLWYTSVASTSADLDAQIATARTQRDQLQSVINENLVYEGRLEILQNRVQTIERLQRNQVSPVVVMDQLSRAMDQVDYIWLNSLNQNGSQVAMVGNSSSQLAVADFITSLENTGYFSEITLGSLQQAAGDLWTFDLTTNFVPPPLPGDDGADGDDEADTGSGEGDAGEGEAGA